MSKRLRTSAGEGSSGRRSKQQRLFGAPNDDDRPNARINNPSSAGFSTRHIPQHSPPSLATLAARVFVNNFELLSSEGYWEETRKWLKVLPDSIVSKLFALLRVAHPRLLNHAIITTYFLRGDSVALNGEMGVTLVTLSAIPRVMQGEKLHSLELTDISKFSDAAYAGVVSKLLNLRVLVLRNCTRVGPLTVEAAAKSCRKLTTVNLSSTSVTAASVATLVLSCAGLEVLKVAGISSFTDATVSRLINSISEVIDNDDAPLRRQQTLKRLRTLKLRHDNISDTVINPLVAHCPSLARLDVSFTLLRHIPELRSLPPLEKLSLTSTFVSSSDLIELIRHLPRLKILNLGAMGVRPGSTTALMNATAMTLNDDALRRLTDALMGCPDIESINLVQNAKLGTTSRHNSALAHFVQHAGRRCKSLNLSGIPSLRSSDLVGLLHDGNVSQPSPLHTLILNKTGIDDDAAPWLSSCKALEILEVAETKITEEGLFSIVDSCTQLRELNLTGCRGVSIADRRRFFEVWKARKGKMEADAV